MRFITYYRRDNHCSNCEENCNRKTRRNRTNGRSVCDHFKSTSVYDTTKDPAMKVIIAVGVSGIVYMIAMAVIGYAKTI